jgi:hypothetical protein
VISCHIKEILKPHLLAQARDDHLSHLSSPPHQADSGSDDEDILVAFTDSECSHDGDDGDDPRPSKKNMKQKTKTGRLHSKSKKPTKPKLEYAIIPWDLEEDDGENGSTPNLALWALHLLAAQSNEVREAYEPLHLDNNYLVYWAAFGEESKKRKESRTVMTMMIIVMMRITVRKRE